MDELEPLLFNPDTGVVNISIATRIDHLLRTRSNHGIAATTHKEIEERQHELDPHKFPPSDATVEEIEQSLRLNSLIHGIELTRGYIKDPNFKVFLGSYKSYALIHS